MIGTKKERKKESTHMLMAVSVMLMMRTASRWNLSLLTRVKYRSRVIVKVTLENIDMDMRNSRSFSRQRIIDS